MAEGSQTTTQEDTMQTDSYARTVAVVRRCPSVVLPATVAAG